MDVLRMMAERSRRAKKSKAMARIYAGTAVDYASFTRSEGVNPTFDDRFRQLLTEAERHAREAESEARIYKSISEYVVSELKDNGRWSFRKLIVTGLRSPLILLTIVFLRIIRHI